MSAMMMGVGAVVVVALVLMARRVYLRERQCRVPVDDQRWILEGMSFLLSHLGGVAALRARAPFELPAEFDVEGEALGAERAAELFERVKVQMGIAHWPCTLLREASLFDENPAFANTQAVYLADEEDVFINYRPEAETNPRELACIFAHELSHYILDQIGEAGPGGAEREEELTDLCTILTGFGAYSADAALRPVLDQDTRLRDVLRHPSEIRLSKLAYMPQSAMAFAMAIVATLRGDRDEAAARQQLAPRLEFWRATHRIDAAYLDEVRAMEAESAREVRERQVVLKTRRRVEREAPQKKRRRRRQPRHEGQQG